MRNQIILLLISAIIVEAQWQQRRPFGGDRRRQQRPVPLADLFPDFFAFNSKEQRHLSPIGSPDLARKPEAGKGVGPLFRDASDYSFNVMPMGRAIEQPAAFDGSGALKFDQQKQQLQWRQPQLFNQQQLGAGPRRRPGPSRDMMQNRFQGDGSSFLRTFQSPVRSQLAGMADLTRFPQNQKQPGFRLTNHSLSDFNVFPLSNNFFDKREASSPKPPAFKMGPSFVENGGFMPPYRFAGPVIDFRQPSPPKPTTLPPPLLAVTTAEPLIVALDDKTTPAAISLEDQQKHFNEFQRQFIPGPGLPILQVGKDGLPVNAWLQDVPEPFPPRKPAQGTTKKPAVDVEFAGSFSNFPMQQDFWKPYIQRQGEANLPPRVEVGHDGAPVKPPQFWGPPPPPQPPRQFSLGSEFLPSWLPQQFVPQQQLTTPEPATTAKSAEPTSSLEDETTAVEATTTVSNKLPGPPISQNEVLQMMPQFMPFHGMFPPVPAAGVPLQGAPFIQQLPDFRFLGKPQQPPPAVAAKQQPQEDAKSNIPPGEWYPPLNTVLGQGV